VTQSQQTDLDRIARKGNELLSGVTDMRIKNNRGCGPGIPVWFLGCIIVFFYGLPIVTAVTLIAALIMKKKKLCIASMLVLITYIIGMIAIKCH